MTNAEKIEATPDRVFPLWTIPAVCAALLIGHLWLRYAHGTTKMASTRLR